MTVPCLILFLLFAPGAVARKNSLSEDETLHSDPVPLRLKGFLGESNNRGKRVAEQKAADFSSNAVAKTLEAFEHLQAAKRAFVDLMKSGSDTGKVTAFGAHIPVINAASAAWDASVEAHRQAEEAGTEAAREADETATQAAQSAKAYRFSVVAWSAATAAFGHSKSAFSALRQAVTEQEKKEASTMAAKAFGQVSKFAEKAVESSGQARWCANQAGDGLATREAHGAEQMAKDAQELLASLKLASLKLNLESVDPALRSSLRL